MKKLIVSASTLLAVVAIVIGATTAFYGDVETSSGNTLSAGAIDLGIDNESYYNGLLNEGTSWELAFDLDDNEGPADGKYLFFNFLDLKPGDWGEDTISVHVKDNDSWACMAFDVTTDEDNGSTEPELDDEDPYTADDGELDEFVNFVWWADDGDNVLEDDEAETGNFKEGALSDIGDFSVTLADSSGTGVLSSGPLEGSTDYYIGKAWCFGNLEVNPLEQGNYSGPNNPANDEVNPSGSATPEDGGIICNGSGLDNRTQTDKITADVVFTALQDRWNPNFKCGGEIGCLDKADVMLVLDRSGSISNTDPDGGGPLLSELQTLKNAAKAFVDALAPSADGVHVGMVSFSSSATLNSHLTSDGASVKTAIDGLTSGGNTNLEHGIQLADGELDDAHLHDRDDTEAPDIIVLITDGEPTASNGPLTHREDARVAADNAKSDGVEIFAVGVGITSSNATYLKDDIVSPPSVDHYFNAVDFNELEAILADIANCE